MSSPKTRWPLWLALLVQTAVLLTVAGGLLWFGEGIALAVIVATAIVGIAGGVAVTIASFATTPMQAANMVLAGMLVRLFVPLAALVIVPKRWPALAEGGFREQLLILYLVMLVVETYAAIRVTGMARPRVASK